MEDVDGTTVRRLDRDQRRQLTQPALRGFFGVARAWSPLRNHSAIGPDAEPFPAFSKMVKPRCPRKANDPPVPLQFRPTALHRPWRGGHRRIRTGLASKVY